MSQVALLYGFLLSDDSKKHFLPLCKCAISGSLTSSSGGKVERALSAPADKWHIASLHSVGEI